MKTLAEYLFALVLLLWWLLGIVIAHGFWSTAFCLFPPWAFYLVVEFFFHRFCQ